MIALATRQAGLSRLAAFVPLAGGHYQQHRNYDRGPGRHTSVSGLSPYLRFRLVSEAEVLASVLGVHSYRDAEKFVQEVFWRTYWKGWLESHPDAWTRYRTGLNAGLDQISTDAALRSTYGTAIAGRTGLAPFDAWVNELVETGYLHNHARMWFASMWIFTLRLPWELGADFFLRHLLDGDPASNTLSWRWVAGLHTRGKCYLATPGNILRYTEGRFADPGALATAAEPLEDDDLPEVPLDLPEPHPPTAQHGLLLTDEDLSLPAHMAPRMIMGLSLSPTRSPLAVGPLVSEFARAALQDALDRAGTAYRCNRCVLATPDRLDDLVDAARGAGLREVWVNRVPVGPGRAVLESLAERLTPAGIGLREHLSDYDRRAWPHCARGFFQLKKRIPELLAPIVESSQAVGR